MVSRENLALLNPARIEIIEKYWKILENIGKYWKILKLLKNIWFLDGNVTLTSSSPYSCVETFAFPRCGPTPEWRGKLTISHISHLINPQPQSAGPLELKVRFSRKNIGIISIAQKMCGILSLALYFEFSWPWTLQCS